MKTLIGAAAFTAALILSSGNGINPASAATAKIESRTASKTIASPATDISSRRRHHRHFAHVRRFHRPFAFYHPHNYRRHYGSYSRPYRAFGFYRPRYRAYYRPAYASYRPAYYGSPYYYNPYYGPRTFVSIGPFGLGIGFGGGFF